MTETVKTAVFAVAAIAAAGIAYITQPRPPVVDLPDMVGKPLFEGFDNPAQAASLEILRYDEDLGEIHTFRVAKNGRTGAWVIPSHANYPADAEEQMKNAALSLVGVKVLGVATEDPSEHEMFGVVEPDKDGTKLGDRGVGVMVSFRDEKGDDLAELVIGKPVRDAESQRFVRKPGQNPVYAVEIDPEQLSTKFEDWIEEDLLELNAFDVDQLTMKDYSIVPTGTGGAAMELRSDAVVNWNATESEWELEKLVTYRGAEGTEGQLAENEELDKEKLNEAKNALADLKIVDVRRKPAGLGADLKADESFADDAQSRRDLQSKGFYVNPTDDGGFELLSANGEIHARMKDGYRYLLRFGGVEGTDDDSEEGGLNRYLFVTASVDYSLIPEPDLEDLPQDDTADSGEGTSDGSESDGGESDGGEDSADPAGEGDSDATTADAENSTDAAAADSEGAGDEDARQRRLAAERERITRDNQRKLDEYEEKKKSAETKVNELNTRFADWYYVISEDVYRKIHLGLSDIIVEKEKGPEEGTGLDAFRSLEDTGLQKSE